MQTSVALKTCSRACLGCKCKGDVHCPPLWKKIRPEVQAREGQAEAAEAQHGAGHLEKLLRTYSLYITTTV